MKEEISNLEIVTLTFIVLSLIGFLSYFFYDSSVLIGKCKNNVPVEYCNSPAGDFAVEPDSSSANVESGCGADERSPCIFPNIASISSAIKKCNSLENKCNRFIYENNTMTVVSLTGNTISSLGSHMFVRQNGITFQGQGNPNNSYSSSQVPGENTSVTSSSGSYIATASGATSSQGVAGYGTTMASSTPASGGGGGYGGGY